MPDQAGGIRGRCRVLTDDVRAVCRPRPFQCRGGATSESCGWVGLSLIYHDPTSPNITGGWVCCVTRGDAQGQLPAADVIYSFNVHLFQRKLNESKA